MLSYVYVAIGSALGGLTRFVVGGWLQRRLDDLVPRTGTVPFPIGTMLVNVTGSFLLGVVLVVVARQGTQSNMLRLLLGVGFCGGYTTFSTFSADTLALVEGGATATAMLHVLASVALALAAAFAGALLARAALGKVA
ncbi:MAG: fluoride efflux transporter CrcB [Gemmatimonadaceae bacterium]